MTSYPLGLVMFDSLNETAVHKKYFRIRILWIGILWKRNNVFVHEDKGFVELADGGIGVSRVVHQTRRINHPRVLVNCSGAVILSLLSQPIARKVHNPSVMWILFKRIVHVGNGGNQIVIGCILKPVDNRLLS